MENICGEKIIVIEIYRINHATMYKKLYTTFYYTTYSYHLFSPRQAVVDKLDELFSLKKGLFKSPNLQGKFVDYPDTFFVTQKWWFAHINNFEREPAILKGVITKTNENETIIEIAVRPNSIFLILFIFFLPFGIYGLYKAAVTNELSATLVGLWTFIFALPVLYFFAKNYSNKLRRSFERYMSINPDQK